MHTYTVGELAELVAGKVEGDEERRVSGVAPVDKAGPNDVTFVLNERYARRLAGERAGACLVPPHLRLEDNGTVYIRVENPEIAFSAVLELFHPARDPEPSVHPTAIVGPGVRLGDRLSIGPFVTIESDAVIGDGTHVGAHTHIGWGAIIGEDCRIGPSCSVLNGVEVGDRVRLHTGVRLGVDGFGYATGPEGLTKIPQVGGCVIGDDVEIGANTTVDRGALGDTVIGAGTKIDNIVHIAHNVTIGARCVIVAQVGIAGSVDVGDGVQMAGQAGIAGHLTVGAGARIGAQAGVIGDVPPGAVYSGYPARPHRESLRVSAATFRLPDLQRRVADLERRLAEESG
jgi:UDP-3-O-[3-hydroxymyristoyl] glucosamine N-acyltransferase